MTKYSEYDKVALHTVFISQVSQNKIYRCYHDMTLFNGELECVRCHKPIKNNKPKVLLIGGKHGCY